MSDYKGTEINPLSLMESLADEAIGLVKMEMDVTQEVALYEQGIRLTAKAWGIPDSFPEELLQEIQQAKTEPRIPPEITYRPAEVTQGLMLNLYNTLFRLTSGVDQQQFTRLINFAVDYPEPLLGRCQESKAQTQDPHQAGQQNMSM